jgi:ribosomal protein S18 acetylase RimI-like enzyme
MKIIYKGKTKTDKEIIIRYPEIGDLEKLLKFINELSDERTFIRYQGEHETLESEKKWLEGRLKEIEGKKTVHLLVFSGETLVGASEIHMMDKTEKHIGILGITISKKFRGEGVGKLLMDLIIKEAQKELTGLKIITLNVYGNNEIAIKLYTKMGFVKYGLLPGGVSRGNGFEDDVLMYRKIN